MIALKVISHLLDYPTQELWDNRSELIDALQEADELPVTQVAKLMAFIHRLTQQELLDAQSHYSELFDRGRARSLLLFEHVHGESRSRGQAMVDLLNQYQQAGITLSSRELPDYLPTYLEYLTLLSTTECIEGLNNIAPILALLAERLKQRGSDYHALFDVLLCLSQSELDASQLAAQVEKEPLDDTPAALDAVWEEEQVTFLGEGAQCGNNKISQHQRRFAQETKVQYFNVGNSLGTGAQK
ncbi:nitrate reductase molybdenum cofactor assembly chaperone [Providencia stuartii]|uniref:Nitrate reductase n=1 Tax=Providencia stuartii TaxID=588 RepID=A0A1S1HY69_PROST|nr:MULTISPECIES: nitrate reductase molybdenum cofactor assembly chaperone [Providencia]ELR5299356.1 nitrate reductase molybdenum cofactor assembly chaperone [Providencia stuartii]MDW7588430.1 nitrate reductase molybdenum cofactor assembly chaperone [Providencia sp. 2023EL-00965]OHT25300.1 nitrate reductase [Providencia stuartii]